MRQIELSSGKFALIDDADFDRVTAHNWSFDGRYAKRSIRINGKSKVIYLHRFLMDAPEGSFVDHVSGNRLDNRRANLRFVTRAQNGMNRRACVSSASGIKGVYFSAAARKWCAEIRDGSRKIYIGLFESAALAEAAYLGASIVLHGEFSYTHSQRIGAAVEEIA